MLLRLCAIVALALYLAGIQTGAVRLALGQAFNGSAEPGCCCAETSDCCGELCECSPEPVGPAPDGVPLLIAQCAAADLFFAASGTFLFPPVAVEEAAFRPRSFQRRDAAAALPRAPLPDGIDAVPIG